MKRPIPFTVVGGFLGSGKTTLLNRILLRPESMHYAILVNDFGALNIDAELLGSQKGKVVRLSNGCICCTIGDGLVSTLLGLLKVKPRPTRIVVEASGVADPARIADFARLSPSLVLDGIVVLVDAEQVRSQIDDPYVGEMVDKQLTAADVLILNKRDLLSPARWEEVRDWLQAKVPNTKILAATQANVPVEKLLSAQPLTERERHAFEPGRLTRDRAPADRSPDHGATFRSWQFTSTSLLDRDKLQHLLAELPKSIVRIKGFVRLSDTPDQLQSLQKVGSRWSIVEHRDSDTIEGTTRLVVLGNVEMPEDRQLARWFASLRVHPP